MFQEYVLQEVLQYSTIGIYHSNIYSWSYCVILVLQQHAYWKYYQNLILWKYYSHMYDWRYNIYKDCVTVSGIRTPGNITVLNYWYISQ